MSESILNALIHLFAIVANVNQEGVTAKGRKIVEAYLLRYLNNEFIGEYLRITCHLWFVKMRRGNCFAKFDKINIYSFSNETPPSIINFSRVKLI